MMNLVRRAPVFLAAILAAYPASGDTRDLYSEINVTGTVTVKIAGAGGAPGCANVWWVKRLIGGVRQLGRICGTATIEVPSFLGMSLASKLRASADRGTVITVTAREGTAKTISFDI